MNISYSYLMGCDIYRIRELVETVEETLRKRRRWYCWERKWIWLWECKGL